MHLRKLNPYLCGGGLSPTGRHETVLQTASLSHGAALETASHLQPQNGEQAWRSHMHKNACHTASISCIMSRECVITAPPTKLPEANIIIMICMVFIAYSAILYWRSYWNM